MSVPVAPVEAGHDVAVPMAAFPHTLIEHTPGFICVHDFSGVLLMVSDGATRMLGYTREEMVGRPLRKFIAGSHHQGDGGLDYRSPCALIRFARRDGRPMAVAYQSVQVTVPGAPPAMMIYALEMAEGRELAAAPAPMAPTVDPGAAAREASDLEQAAQQIRVSERRLRHVVEHVREVFFETDVVGRWTYLNPAWSGITGFSVDESLGQPFWDFVWDDDVEVSVARFNPLIARERTHSRHEIRYRTKDDSFRWMEVHVQVVIEPGEGIVGTCGTLRDVTAQRDLSEQLVRARETAMMASRTKGDFLANMSHEIRTPMNGVIGLTDLLLDTALTSEQREYAEGVKQSGEALLTLINDILDFSKIEAGKLTIEAVPHDLHKAIREAMNLVTIKARNKGLQVALALAEDLADSVVGDPVRIRQVLINLIDNAVKFTHIGTVTVSVAPESGEAPGVRFAVTDTGIGIDPDKLEFVFEKFTQADTSTTRRYGGSGLGLAICKQLVELMGGEIGVTSQPGSGSTFWFRLPLAAVDPLAVSKPARLDLARPRPAPEFSRPFRVLVADDSAINLKVACQMLSKLGCDVDFAEDGGAAVEMVGRRAYDVVFMDCQMPILDGYEATARIRRLPNHRGVRIVAMTAHAMAGDRERCLAAGMNDYVSKPIAREELRRVLSELTPVPAEEEPSAAEIAGATAGDPLAPVAAGTTPAAPGAARLQLTPTFDKAQLWARMDGDGEMIRELVNLLSSDGPTYASALSAAMTAGDLIEAERLAHTLKGSVSHFEAHRAIELARRIEAAVRSDRAAEALELARQLEVEIMRLVADLREWASTLPLQTPTPASLTATSWPLAERA